MKKHLLALTMVASFFLIASLCCVNSKQIGQYDAVTVDNEVFFHVVTSFIDEGRMVIMPCKGTSMLPMIQDGDALVLEPIKSNDILLFDVVLYEPSPGSFFVNRVVKVNDQSVTIMGDASVKSTTFNKSIVRARVTSFITNENKAFSLVSQEARTWAQNWHKQQNKRDALLESTSQEQVTSQLSKQPMPTTGFSSVGQFESLRKYRRQNNVLCISLDEMEVVIKDENPIDLRKCVSLNETALYLWDSVTDSVFNPASLARLLTDTYDVSYTRAYSDCVDLIKDWLSIGIIKYADE